MTPILVTGGAGYIGSFVCKVLESKGYLPITFDNLSHGHKWAVRYGPLFQGDLQNVQNLDEVILKYKPKAVIHLAGSIHLRESIENPYSHYYNNVVGTLSLLNALVRHGINELVFSSSAAVYAIPKTLPIKENHAKCPINPYGKTKWMSEQIFEDFQVYGIKTASLRFFNAAGADPDDLKIGEAHSPETHLIPRLLEASQNPDIPFTMYSNQFPTKDGTAIRDFVHVLDLALAHVKALEWLEANQKSVAINLGTGHGYSVKEVLKKVEEITDTTINIDLKNQSFSELPELVADISLAKELLNWTPIHSDLDNIIETAWMWYKHSKAYEKAYT